MFFPFPSQETFEKIGFREISDLRMSYAIMLHVYYMEHMFKINLSFTKRTNKRKCFFSSSIARLLGVSDYARYKF